MMNQTSRPKLVAFHHDITVLRTIADTAAPHFDTIRVRDVARAATICQEDEDVRGFIAEHAVHPATGSSIFDYLRQRCPHVRRLMLTDYADLGPVVAGLHSGGVQYLAHFPLDATDLLTVLASLAGSLVPASVPRGLAMSPTRLSA